MYKNIFANIIGKFWSILSNFLFIPIYIHLLGLESYSVISFTLVLVGLLAVLDSGLTATLSREFASDENALDDKIRIFKTLETCYFIITVVIIAIIFLCSNVIAQKWLNLNQIPIDEVSYYLKIISVGVGFQFLSKFYFGGMLGLEYQVKANMYQVAWGVTRNGLVILLLMISPSLLHFFVWQSVVTVIYALVLRVSVFKLLGNSKDFFSKLAIEQSVLQKIKNFALGMLLISLVAGLNSQMDKIAISKLLSIENLGYYTIAVSLSYGLITITTPISTALLPKFTYYFTSGQEAKGVSLFHKVYKYVIILVFSFALVIGFYASEILWIWTNDAIIVEKVTPLVLIMALAISMLAIAIIPFNIAIANAYTKLNNYLGIISLLITLPGYWFFAAKYGSIGAASVFCFVQVIVTFIYTHFINIKFLNQMKTIHIMFKYFLLPFVFIGGLVFALKLLPIHFENRILSLCWIGINLITVLGASLLVFSTKKDKEITYLKYKNLKSKLLK